MESPFNQIALRSPFFDAGVFTPLSLFAASEPGAWYDPSDMSTMFQDAAGTTPVTAVEQPVSCILDKSGRGNHATTPAGATASRPVLSARYNLLTKTEQLTDAVWSAGNAGVALAPTVTANYAPSPDGVNNAARIQYSLNGGTSTTDQSFFRQTVSKDNLLTYTWSFYARSTDGSSTYSMQMFGAPAASQNITITGNWTRFVITGSGTNANMSLSLRGGQTPVNSNTADILFWWPDFRVSNDGVGLPVYQRVNTSTDYDTSGFPMYLRFDGSDDYMLTGTITPGTDKAQVFAGVRKLSDAALGVVAEIGTYAQNGTFSLGAPAASSATYRFGSVGSIAASAISPSSYASPITNVMAGIGDISGDVSNLRLNSATAATVTTDQGTGSYNAAPLYIGRRSISTQPYNGRLFGLIVRFGANLDNTQITNTETWMNGKTKAY